MAERSKRVAENVAGQFYVDDTCIDCELCRETAPANFTLKPKARRYSLVARQPDGPAEQAACLAAMEECPVEAIGDDGG